MSTLDTMPPNDARAMRELERYGYAVLPGLLDSEQTSQLAALLTMSQKAHPPTLAPYYELSATGEAQLMRVENFFGDPTIASHLVALLGEQTHTLASRALGEPAVLFKDKLNVRPPGSRGDRLHQDHAAGWSTYCPLVVTLCIAIDPNTQANGALQFQRRSSRARELLGGDFAPLTSEDMQAVPAPGFEQLLLAPGDCVLFDSFAPHGSSSNGTSASRRNYFVSFSGQPAGDQRGRYYADKLASYPPNTPESARPAATYRV